MEREKPIPSTLAGLSLAMLLPSLGTSVANVALPALAQAFGASFQAAQWIVLAYLLATTTLVVGVGRLGDIVGRRRLLLVGVSLFTVASVFCATAPALPALIAARALQGLGAAVMMALSVALVGEIVPRDRIGSAMGLLGTMSAVGTALGPALGGFLIDGLGWQAIFFVNLPLGVLAFALVYRLPADFAPKVDRPAFDVIGTFLLGLALAFYALAMTIGRGSFGPFNAMLMVAAAVGLGLFVLVETKTPSPLIRPAMLRDRELSASLVMSALVATVMMATLIVGPFYLSRALGLDAFLVGIVMTAGPLVAASAGVPAGHIVDRVGTSYAMAGGLAGVVAGCGLLAVVPAALGIPGYVAPLVIVTAGYALFQAANNTAVMKDQPSDRRGVVSGILNLSRNLGLVTGASFMGAIFVAASGEIDISSASPAAVADGMRFTFATAAILALVALAIAVGNRARVRHA